MYIENAKAKRPNKTKIMEKNGIKYVLHVIDSTYNKDKKYNSEKRVIIGKMIDENTMIPNDNFSKFYNMSDVILEETDNTKSRYLNLGATVTFEKIVKKNHLLELLGDCFPDDEDNTGYAAKIFDLASYFLITEDSVAQNFESYAKRHSLLSDLKDDSDISKFYKTLKISTQSELFYKKWIQENLDGGRIFVNYDSTNFPNYSNNEGVELADFGKAKVFEQEKQINVAYAIQQISGTPLVSEIYNGSINDVSQMKYFLNKLRSFGLKGVNLVIDRGYFSKQNLEEISKVFSGFLICSKTSNLAVANMISRVENEIKRIDNYISNKKLYAITKTAKLFKDDLNGMEKFFHIYWNEQQFVNEKTAFYEDLTSLKEKILNLHTLPEELSNNSNLQYFNITKDEKNNIKAINFNQNLIAETINTFGYFCLISSMELTALEALNIYEKRNNIEKIFTAIKSHLGGNVARVHSDSAIKAKFFVVFIATIIRNEIFNSLSSLRSRNNKDFTVPQTISQLEEIIACKLPNKSYAVLDGPTKRQNEILKALNVTMKEIFNECTYINKRFS